MTWVFQRATTGLQYTPFEFDQEEDYGRKPYIQFIEGRAPLMPVDYLESARQVKQTNGRLPDLFTERTHHICNERFRDLIESFEPGIHFFRPIALRRKNGDPLAPHFLWTVGQDVDCILTEGLDRYWETQHDGSVRFSFFDLESDARFKRPKDDPTAIVSPSRRLPACICGPVACSASTVRSRCSCRTPSTMRERRTSSLSLNFAAGLRKSTKTG